MSRRRKKARRARVDGRRSTVDATPGELEARGREALEAGRHRDAIAAFKELVRREPHPDWVEALAQAYSGRARGLADKGMFKEAIAMLRIRAESCGRTPADLLYLDLLFQTGQIEAAVELIRAHRPGPGRDLRRVLAEPPMPAVNPSPSPDRDNWTCSDGRSLCGPRSRARCDRRGDSPGLPGRCPALSGRTGSRGISVHPGRL